MSQTQAALDHLRVIRSLMEKAHIYRAVSAPAALLGGVLALVASVWPVVHAAKTHGEAAFSDSTFLLHWHGILAACTVLNVVLLAREAKRRDQPLVSEGMKMALRAVSPPLIVGGVLALGLVVWLHNLTLGALIWVLCYGLALLATSSFAPKSLIRLGWAFVIAGLVLFLAWAGNDEVRNLRTDLGPASLVMALTFGLLHLVYAIAVFASRPKSEEVAA
jgi:hypothetical protein